MFLLVLLLIYFSASSEQFNTLLYMRQQLVWSSNNKFTIHNPIKMVKLILISFSFYDVLKPSVCQTCYHVIKILSLAPTGFELDFKGS